MGCGAVGVGEAAVGVGDAAVGVGWAALGVGEAAVGVGDAALDEAAPAVVVAVAVFAAVVLAGAAVVVGAELTALDCGTEVAGAEVAADCVGDALVGAGALVDACCVSCIGEVGTELDGRSVGTVLVAAGNSVVAEGLGDGLPVAETTGADGDSSEGTARVMGGIEGSVVSAGVGTSSFTEGSTV